MLIHNPQPISYSRIELMGMLGEEVEKQILASTDPNVKVVEKRFEALGNSRLLPFHPLTVDCFDKLIASPDVPAFTLELRQAIEGA